jgi:hypothetical protein
MCSFFVFDGQLNKISDHKVTLSQWREYLHLNSVFKTESYMYHFYVKLYTCLEQ